MYRRSASGKSHHLHIMCRYARSLLDCHKQDISSMNDLCIRSVHNRPYQRFLHTRDIVLQFVLSTLMFGHRICTFPSALAVISYINILSEVFTSNIRIDNLDLSKYLRIALHESIEWRNILNMIIFMEGDIPIDILLCQPVCYVITRSILNKVTINVKVAYIRRLINSTIKDKIYLTRLQQIFEYMKNDESRSYSDIKRLINDCCPLADKANVHIFRDLINC